MAIKLPPNPRELQYEDFVAAWLSALGYFIETRVRRHNVLELDVVASAPGVPMPRVLVEAKSGKWGFPDLFKVYGWRMYLSIPAGYVVANAEPDEAKRTLIDTFYPRTNVAGFAVHPQAGEKLWSAPLAPVSGLANEDRELLLQIAWYQRIANRLAYDSFTSAVKSNADDELYQQARTYDFAVEASFFEATAEDRVRRLYEAFKSNAKVSSKLAERIAKQKNVTTIDVFNKLQDEPDLLWLQYIVMLEHRARILIIKNALDIEPPTRKAGPSRHPGFGVVDWDYYFYQELPANFRSGRDALSALPFKERVPLALQVFFEYFGGFLIGDDDINLLARLVGLDPQQTRTALSMLDVFFPMTSGNKSWCFASHSGQLTRLKFCPALIRGCGSFMRMSAYKLDNYGSKFGKLDYALVPWHNAVLRILEREIKDDTPEVSE